MIETIHVDDLARAVERVTASGGRFASLVADHPAPPGIQLDYVFVVPGARSPFVLRVAPAGDAPSIALACPAASWAERETTDLHGVVFTGSPDPRRLVHHEDWPVGLHPLRDEVSPRNERVDGTYPYDHVEGDGVMEIRVGPIHAGIIEPGHFRFSTIGETVLGLEIRLGYVHRGVELAARGRMPAAALILAERISGTASVAHAVALARAFETALGVVVPPEHALWRSLLVELERITNHAGDLGNLCAGTALAGVLAEGFILKESLLEASAQLSGSRYLRGLVGLGGLRRFPPAAVAITVLGVLDRAGDDLERLAEKFFGSATNLERLTGTGVLATVHARALGTVGIVARASQVATDSRADLDFPSPIDREIHEGFTAIVETTGDVAARARLRVEEVRASIRLIHTIVGKLARLDACPPGIPARQDGAGYGWCEGARGEILTFVRVVDGRVARLRVRSPSRMNWRAIELAMPGNIVPDFPLINKSFNLSYAGCDL